MLNLKNILKNILFLLEMQYNKKKENINKKIPANP